MDWAKGGLEFDDTISIAKMIKRQGCDLLHVLAGETIPNIRPTCAYFFNPINGRICNEVGIPTITSDGITIID